MEGIRSALVLGLVLIALRTATGSTQDTNIHLHDETLILPIYEHLQLCASQYKQKTQHPSHPLHKHTTYNIQHTSTLKAQKPTIFNNGHYTTNIPTDPHTVTTTYIKSNLRHIHTSIVSKHLSTRDNNKIMRTPPPHISSSEEILPRLFVAPLSNSEQINHPSSNHIYTKSTTNHIHHHYAPSVTLTHTRHTSSLQLHPHTHHIVTPGVTALLARWTEKPTGGPQAGTSDYVQKKVQTKLT